MKILLTLSSNGFYSVSRIPERGVQEEGVARGMLHLLRLQAANPHAELPDQGRRHLLRPLPWQEVCQEMLPLQAGTSSDTIIVLYCCEVYCSLYNRINVRPCLLSLAHHLGGDQLPGPALALRLLRVPHLPQIPGRRPLHLPRGQRLLRGLLQDRRGQEVPRLQEPHHRSAEMKEKTVLQLISSVFSSSCCFLYGYKDLWHIMI